MNRAHARPMIWPQDPDVQPSSSWHGGREQVADYSHAFSWAQDNGIEFHALLLGAVRAAHYLMTRVEDAAPVGLRPDACLTSPIPLAVHPNSSLADLWRAAHASLTSADASSTSACALLSSADAFAPQHAGSFAGCLVHWCDHLSCDHHEFESYCAVLFDVGVRFCPSSNKTCTITAMSLRATMSEEAVDCIVALIRNVLQTGPKHANVPLSCLPLTCDFVPHQTATGPHRNSNDQDGDFVKMFQHHVAITPERIALKDNLSSYSYSRLDELSGSLAQWLLRRDLPTGSSVVLIAERSCLTVVTLLAVLKAGLVYVPVPAKDATLARIHAILASIPGKTIILHGDSFLARAFPTLEMTSVRAALDEAKGSSSIYRSFPNTSPNSIGWILFTSGSTGEPKGVVLQQRTVLRLVRKDHNVLAAFRVAGAVCAWCCGMGFDASMWEVSVALLTGATLVCVDESTVIDYNALRSQIRADQIRFAIMPTALIRSILVEAPDILSQLQDVICGGEALPVEDAYSISRLIHGNFLPSYGLTETGILNCFALVQRSIEHYHPKGIIPLGVPSSDSGILVVDSELRAVPVGVIGEILIHGDGLASGYTNIALNENRFVQVSIAGTSTRAYRTGDMGRWLPRNHELQMLGRIDNQVKVHGHRIELDEVERAMLSVQSVAITGAVACAATTTDPNNHSLVGYFTIRGDERSRDAHLEARMVDDWAHSEEIDPARIKLVQEDPRLLGRDFIGWTSVYNGQPLDLEEMNEWLQDTISTVLDDASPQHVLEIGTGSGMLLFNMAANLRSYIGLEPARVADWTRNMAQQHTALKNVPVTIVREDALCGIRKLRAMPGPAPTLVVMNSVIQYFPSEDYLHDVLQLLLEWTVVERIVIGDVRSWALYRQFRAAYHRTTQAPLPHQDYLCSASLAESARREHELLLHPSFLTRLKTLYPKLVRHVEIVPKLMKADNELSRFRFTAIIHTVRSKAVTANCTRSIPESSWIDFKCCGLDEVSLEALIRRQCRTSESLFAVGNITNSRLSVENALLECQESDEQDLDVDKRPLIDTIAETTRQIPGLSAYEIQDVAHRNGVSVSLSWARQGSQRGAFDAIFYRARNPADAKAAKEYFEFPKDETIEDGYTSSPLRAKQLQECEAQMRRELMELLPSYMCPTNIRVLASWPLTANGKLDRRKLRQLASMLFCSGSTSSGAVRPRSALEARLCELFAAVLGIAHTRPDDNFFALGGHSLLAARLAGLVRKQMMLAVKTTDIIAFPTPAALAERLFAQPASAMEGSSSIESVAGDDATIRPVFADLSSGQQRLWFFEQLHPGTIRFVVAQMIRIEGNLDVGALKAALSAIEQRHEALRTIIIDRGDGVAVQQIQPPSHNFLRVVESIDDIDLERQLCTENSTPFRLEKEPGWRVKLVRCRNRSEPTWVLSIAMHHMFVDASSMAVLNRELQQFYCEALRSPGTFSLDVPAPFQSRHISAWEKVQGPSAAQQQQLQFWTAQIQNSKGLVIPRDNAPAKDKVLNRADVETFRLRKTTFIAVRDFAVANGVTPFVVLLTAFCAAQYRMTGVCDATIGTFMSRRQYATFENLVGLLANPICVRALVEPAQDTFQSLLSQLSKRVQNAMDNQDVPFAEVVTHLRTRALDAQAPISDHSESSFLNTFFNVHVEDDLLDLRLQGVETQPVRPFINGAQDDVEFVLFSRPDETYWGEVRYNTDFYQRHTFTTLVALFQETLDYGMSNPNVHVDSLSLSRTTSFLSPRMGMRLSAYPRESSIIDVFRMALEINPSAVAVKDIERQLTYADLDRESEAICSWLAFRDFTAESIVAVHGTRSCSTIASYLGILKANMAYLPLERRYPTERIRSILKALPAGSLKAILKTSPTHITDETHLWKGYPTPACVADILNGLNGSEITHRVISSPLPNNLAYVLFTSGSTGTPKGVMIEHRGIVRLTKGSDATRGVIPGMMVAHMSSIAFDASTWEIYGTLLNGGTLVCIDPNTVMDLNALCSVFKRESIRAAIMVPTFLKLILRDHRNLIADLALLHVIGERFDPNDARLAARITRGQVVNNYGPTEDTVTSTTFIVNPTASLLDNTPIGSPIENSGAMVVDPQLRLVPPGVLGELLLVGDGLARGYVHGPDPKFVTFSMQGKTCRGYRTGDRAKWRTSDGLLEFHGRMDHQVKVNGQRVELEEIERALEAEEDVISAAACLRTTADSTDLICYVTLQPVIKEQNARASRLRENLTTHLPIYMVPTQIQVLERMPVSVTGKIDRVALGRLMQSQTPSHIHGAQQEKKIIERRLSLCGHADMEQKPTDAIARSSAKPSRKERLATEARFRNEPTSPCSANNVMTPLDTVIKEECAPIYTQAQITEHIRDAWAHLLQLDVGDISAETNFFASGGHSITAMQLAANVKRRHILLPIQDILQSPTLSGMAQAACREQNGRALQTESSSTPGGLDALHSIRVAAAEACDVPTADIEDVYPCTPAQAAIMAVSEYNRSAYFVQFHYTLPEHLNQRRFVAALMEVVYRRPILRTRIFHFPGKGAFQAVLRPSCPIEFVAEQGPFDSMAKQSLYGAALNRFFLDDARKFSWIIHHSLYDARSLVMYQQDIVDAYLRVPLAADQSFGEHCWRVAHLRETVAAQAERFWHGYLADSVAPSWPVVGPQCLHMKQRRSTRQVYHITCPAKTPEISRYTDYSLAKLAWAVVLAGYSGHEDVIFASSITDGDVGGAVMLGPTLTSIVARVRCNDDLPVEELLAATQNEFGDVMRFQHTGLSDIRRAAGWSHDWSSMSLLTVNTHQQNSRWPLEDLGIPVAGIKDNVAAEFPITVVVESTSSGEHDITIYHDPEILAPKEGLRVAQQFGHVFSQLHSAKGTARLSEINWTSPQDRRCLAQIGDTGTVNTTHENDKFWHDDAGLPTAPERLTHMAKTAAESLAVEAWDGCLSYAELDDEACVLSAWLHLLGVVRGDVVACCLSRSKYSAVLIHAIWKSGATYTPLDPRDPPQRLRELMARTRAKVVITNSHDIHDAIPESMILDGLIMDRVSPPPPLPSPSPSLRELAATHPAYLLFTSGSTGSPKGVIMSHRALAVAARSAKRFATGIRMLQLAPLSFDVSIAEIVWTLYHGSCICVPRDDDIAQDVMRSIEQYSVDTIYITPGRLMSQEIPVKTCLRRLYICGEPYNHNDMLPWLALLPGAVFNMYGITEACVINYVTLLSPTDRYSNALATPLVGRMWIIRCCTSLVLAPIGAVGEIVLDGPMLADGYWDDIEQSTVRFPQVSANWPFTAGGGSKTSARRVYRTGDLGVYLNDGRIQYCGRADDQVKINGQRLELGEVQRHVADALDDCGVSNRTVVSMVPFEDLTTPRMTLFTAETAFSNVPIEIRRNKPGDHVLTLVQAFLKERLPTHMIPSGHLHLSRIPLSSNGKVDRKALSLLTKTLSFAEAQSSFPIVDESCGRWEGQEQVLAMIWKEALPHARERELPRPDSSFFALGGDSMTAVYLAKAARNRGRFLSVADIIRHPRLRDQAKCMRPLQERHIYKLPSIGPFDLLEGGALSSIKRSHGQRWADVEDIWPLNITQMQFVRRTQIRPRDYFNQFWFTVDGIAFEQLCSGLERLVTIHQSLRARLIEHQGELYHVILKVSAAMSQVCHFDGKDSFEDALEMESRGVTERPLIGPGSAMARLRIISIGASPRYVLMTFHHAIYDGCSLLNMRDSLRRACLQPESVIRPRFSPASFVQLSRACASSERSRAFWIEHLRSTTAVSPLDLLKPGTSPDPASTVGAVCMTDSWSFRTPSQPRYTFATMLHVAVAVSLSSCADVPNPCPVLRSNMMGRERGYDGMDTFFGCTLSSVPLCVTVCRPGSEDDVCLSSMLHEVQKFFTVSMLEHGLFQYPNIAALTPQTARACGSAATITVEAIQHVNTAASISTESRKPNISFDLRTDLQKLGNSMHGFLIVFYPVQNLDSGSTVIHVTVVHDKNLISRTRVAKIVSCAEKVFRDCLELTAAEAF